MSDSVPLVSGKRVWCQFIHLKTDYYNETAAQQLHFELSKHDIVLIVERTRADLQLNSTLLCKYYDSYIITLLQFFTYF